MTRTQKQDLAFALIRSSANLVETIGERSGYNSDIQDINPTEAAQQLANWLRHLPGDGWDMRLPQPARLDSCGEIASQGRVIN